MQPATKDLINNHVPEHHTYLTSLKETHGMQLHFDLHLFFNKIDDISDKYIKNLLKEY